MLEIGCFRFCLEAVIVHIDTAEPNGGKRRASMPLPNLVNPN